MVKVLIFGLSSNLGGIESFFINHLKCNNNKNIIYDFVFYHEVHYQDDLIKYGSKIHYIKYRRRKNPIKYYKEIKKILKENEYDFVWQNVMSTTNLAPIKYAKKRGIKTILHIHGSGTTEASTISKILSKLNKRKMYKYTDIYFTCSNNSAEYAFGKNANKAIFIPNAIDLNKFKYSNEDRKKIRNELEIPKTSLVIGNVARLTPVKNLFYLIDIFKEVHNKHKDSYLVLVGDGYLKNELEKYSEDLRIKDKCLFLGVRRDVNKILSALDTYVMPSISEGFPISVIEAQASGLDVFVSDRVTKEINISKDVTFMSIDIKPKIWAEKIIENYNNKAKRNICIKTDRYDVEKNMEHLNKILIKNK